MFQGKECAQRVAHLIIVRSPVNLRILEIVEYLITSGLLTIINEWHAIDGIGQHRECIAVFAIFLGQRLLRLVVVLIVVGDIEHTVKR